MSNEGGEIRVGTGYIPRPLQAEIHRSLRRFSVLVCHRRFGKTILAINALIDAAVRCSGQQPRYAYIAPLYRQAKAIAWDYLQRYALPIPGTERNKSELFVEFPHGARITLYGADNPDSMRGLYFDGVVLDEVAQMRPEVWAEIIRPELVDRKGWALFIGTPKGINIFHELYQQAIRNDVWYAGMFRASETGIIPADELEAARSMMSPSQYAQEFECDFSAANEDVLIPLDLVQKASRRDLHPTAFEHAPVVIGVDVARFGDDRSVLVVRQGLKMLSKKTWKGIDTAQLGDLVIQEMAKQKAAAVFVDVVGIGAGVVDYMKSLRYKTISVNGGEKARNDSKYFNRRAEMWDSMRQWLEDGGSIPDDMELKSDLVTLTYTYDNLGRLKLEKKEDAKKRGIASPDVADALALTLASPVRVINPVERIVMEQQELNGENEPRYWRDGRAKRGSPYLHGSVA